MHSISVSLSCIFDDEFDEEEDEDDEPDGGGGLMMGVVPLATLVGLVARRSWAALR